MAGSGEMQSFQGFAGFVPVLALNTDFPAAVGNTGLTGILKLQKNSSQRVVELFFEFIS